jgi:hypothetical protein
MSLSTPNSSFILDRRRLSMRLWAVLRAILRPAAVVVPGACFRLDPAEAEPPAAAALAFDAVGAGAMAVWWGFSRPLGDMMVSSLEDWRGFIWMIFLDRVGGGGRTYSSLGDSTALLFRLEPAACLVREGMEGGGVVGV